MQYNLYRALRPKTYRPLLSKRRCWYADDPPADDTPPASPPDTPPDKTGDTGTPGQTFTQDDIDRIVGERAKRAAEKALADFVQGMGFEKADDVKSLVEAEKQRKEQEMSEVEKLQAELEKERAATKAAKEAAEQAAQTVIDQRRDSAILTALKDAERPQSVLNLLKAEQSDMVAAILNDDNVVQDKPLAALVEKAKADYGGMFKTGGPGTGSHAGGTPPTAERQKLLDKITVRY